MLVVPQSCTQIGVNLGNYPARTPHMGLFIFGEERKEQPKSLPNRATSICWQKNPVRVMFLNITSVIYLFSDSRGFAGDTFSNFDKVRSSAIHNWATTAQQRLHGSVVIFGWKFWNYEPTGQLIKFIPPRLYGRT
jgi:hypothetical protein